MNEELKVESAAGEGKTSQVRPGPRMAMAAIAAALIIVALAVWFLWPRQAGKPVPAPRSVSFEESPRQQTAMTGDQKLTLTPEQVQRAGLKIETVGERPSSEAAQMTTGIVQANTYKETPVVSLVSGIVRSVGAELGQNVKRGQTVAVVFSNELSEAQSNYLKALAELDEHHRHHLRTIKLVEIGAASRQDLEMATSKYQSAESDVANLKQKLFLLGMSPQRVNALNSTSQISSEVTVTAPASGTITSRTANSGQVIEANKELMRVTDLSTVQTRIPAESFAVACRTSIPRSISRRERRRSVWNSRTLDECSRSECTLMSRSVHLVLPRRRCRSCPKMRSRISTTSKSFSSRPINRMSSL